MRTPVGKRGVLAVLLALCLLVAACGDNPPTPTAVTGTTLTPGPAADYGVPKNPKIAAMGPVDLHVLFASDYYQVKPVVDVANAFMQMYPNVKITLEGTEWGQIPAQVRTEISGGNVTIDLAHQHAFVMGAQGYAEPLDDMLSQIDTSGFMPGAVEDTVWDGVHYGVPLDINCLFTIYRKDLFQKAGLADPGPDWSYTDARQDALKLTHGDVYGIAASNSSWAMSGHVESNGGRLVAADGTTPTIDLPANITMTQFMSDLINVDRVAAPVPPAGQRYDPVELFWAGKAAILWTGPWDLGRIRNEAPDSFKAACPDLSCIGTTTLPHGLGGGATGSVQGGGSLFIPKGSKHKEVAFELMRWYLSPTYQLAMVKDQARYPVLSNLYTRPELTADTLAQPFFKQLQTAHPYRLEANAQANTAWDGAVNAILSGAPAAETLKQAQQQALTPPTAAP